MLWLLDRDYIVGKYKNNTLKGESERADSKGLVGENFRGESNS